MNHDEYPVEFQTKPKRILAMRWTGDNVVAIWDHFGTSGIYGPTEKNPDSLLLTTIDGAQVPCPKGHFVIPEPVADRFYPCEPGVFAGKYEAAEEPVTPDLVVYAMGLARASVCTTLPDEEATARMNASSPSGIESQWAISADRFRGGEPNPCPCNSDPSRRHILFEC